MIDPSSLLELARELAQLDPRRPRQAALRRAVSTAYYALYHRIVLDGANHLVGYWGTGDERAIGDAATRWFTHQKLAAACAHFSGPSVKGKLRDRGGVALSTMTLTAGASGRADIPRVTESAA